jgi:hypothetical protein
MCLVKMVDPDSVFCRGRGISEVQTREAVLKELLQSAASGKLPRDRCDDETAH